MGSKVGVTVGAADAVAVALRVAVGTDVCVAVAVRVAVGVRVGLSARVAATAGPSVSVGDGVGVFRPTDAQASSTGEMAASVVMVAALRSSFRRLNHTLSPDCFTRPTLSIAQ